MHQKISTLCLIVVFAFTLGGCSSMSPQARRERAYRHYVQKHIRERQKQMARAQKAANRQLKQKLKNIQPSDPQMTTSVENAPPPWYSTPTTEAADSTPDTIVAPVTVSASDGLSPEKPEEP